MFDRKMFEGRSQEEEREDSSSRRSTGSRQHQLMVGSLALLLVALGMLLYNDRDFWFPDTQDAEEVFPTPVNSTAAGSTHGTPVDATRGAKKRSSAKAQPKDPLAPAPDPPPVTATRTVLPPLQIEVVAGNTHRTLSSSTNSVHVDLQPGAPTQTIVDPPQTEGAPDTAAGVTSNAAENVQMSADTSATVSHTVKPGYPLLARQMKVQGSVILQALINRDGSIQDLHILSGPPILASAAREAVRQWRFKPHYQGAEPVETLAKITVNFTISTN